MILTSSVQYAITILQSVRKTPGQLVPAYKIAKDNNLSPAFVDQICRKLKVNGVIKSNRGPGGGYCQIKPVTLLELITILSESNTRVLQPSAIEINSKVNEQLNAIMV